MKKPSLYSILRLVSGILLVAAGVCSFFNPAGSIIWLVTFYGVLALITGIADIVFYIRASRFTGFAPMVSLVLGILSVMAGTMMIVHPGSGTLVIILLLPIWFIAHCISRLVSICQMGAGRSRAGYILGIVMNAAGILLGVLMTIYPYISFVSAGILIGTYLILLGIDSVIAAVFIWRYGR